jgi:hypothetical protein
MSMGKLVCEVVKNGEAVVKVVTTAANADIGSFVRTMPGIGKPFWYWPSIPSGTVVGADFTDAPVVVNDIATNNAAKDAITVDPTDVLIYA